MAIICVTASHSALAQTDTTECRGYYKDVFMDSGVMLTSRPNLYASDYLGLTMETFVSNNHTTSKNTQADTLMQTMLLTGYTADENGILLYPDGSPRFRMIYMNGGRAGSHGRSLGEEGRQRYIDFVAAGGSYVGTCAGMFFTCRYLLDPKLEENANYSHIWPGVAKSTGIIRRLHCADIEPGSPLLRYYDFGGDLRVDSLYHNGGGYAVLDTLQTYIPQGTEVLARYDVSMLPKKERVQGKPLIWAYKASADAGRVVCCGSHPEMSCEGEQLQLMSAMMRYAMDGNAAPKVKASLSIGERRAMTSSTHHADPAHTKIGDRQYHHFTVEVPEGQDSLIIDLNTIKGWEGYDLYLLANPTCPAWLGEAAYVSVGEGAVKTLRIGAPAAGTWYVSVFGATTPTAIQTDKGTRYIDHLDVLNGIPYMIGINTPAVPVKKK